MPSLSKLTPAQISKRIAAIDVEIERTLPELVAEKRLLEAFLASKQDGGVSGVYSGCQNPLQAIYMALDIEGDFTIDRNLLRDRIVAGGYRGPRITPAADVIRVSIDNHLKAKNLIERHGKIGRPEASRK